MPGAASERSLPPVPAPAPSPSGTVLSEKVRWVSGQQLGLATPPPHSGTLPSTVAPPGWEAVCGRPPIGVHTWDTYGSGKPAHA